MKKMMQLSGGVSRRDFLRTAGAVSAFTILPSWGADELPPSERVNLACCGVANQGGGDMILTVSMERSTWAEVPAKFEAGTPNIADAIGLGAAVDYLAALGMDAVRRHEVEITDYALRRLADVPGVTIFGPMDAEQRGGVVSFELEGVHPHDVGQVLDTKGVAIRTGHHCAQPVMAALQVPATARASFYIYNTREEIDALVRATHEVVQFFGGVRA